MRLTLRFLLIVTILLERVTKPLRDSQATPEARCAAVNFGLANHPGVAWWFEWKCRVRPLLRMDVARPVSGAHNENLDSTDKYKPHGDLLRLQNPRVLEKPNLHHL